MKNDFIIDTLKHRLREGESVQIEGTGTSMWPLIQSGQRVTVVPCDAYRLTVGDIVCFRVPEGMVVHRVVRVLKKPELQYLCRGDSSDTNDPVVRPQDIVGKVSLEGRIPSLTNQVWRVKVKLRDWLRPVVQMMWP